MSFIFDDAELACLRDMSQQQPSRFSDGEDGMAGTMRSSDPGLEDRAVRIRSPMARFHPLQPGSTGRLHVRQKHVYREIRHPIQNSGRGVSKKIPSCGPRGKNRSGQR